MICQIGTTLGICSSLGTKLGPHCKAHIRIIGPALIGCFGDSKVSKGFALTVVLKLFMIAIQKFLTACLCVTMSCCF